jgi:carboxypeptidase family protein
VRRNRDLDGEQETVGAPNHSRTPAARDIMRILSISRAIAFVTIATALISTGAGGQATGDIVGRVVDESGHPIVNARLELLPGSLRVASEDDGHFAFHGVAPGKYSLVARRIGYQPLTTQLEVTASGAKPTIVLVAIPRVLDSVRILERAAVNRYSALVLDDAGAPVPDVSVTVEGVSNTLHTDALGHFVVPKQVHGTLVIRMRKMGYAAYLGSLRMIETRADTLRMSRLAQGLSAVQITEASGFGRDTFVYQDLDQRSRWKTQAAAVISREELSAMGRLNICTALPFTPTGARYYAFTQCARACVVLNGDGGTPMPATAYYADQIEMVEYYPPKSDGSHSLTARGCGGMTPTLVIWLRKDLPAKP